MATIYGSAPLIVGTDDADNIFFFYEGTPATIDGGAGNDRYELQNLPFFGALIIDSAGIDTVFVNGLQGGTITLESLSFEPNTLENLIVTSFEGAGFIGGNDLNNILTSEHSGGETIDGGGGSDTMAAGDGDDTYMVDSTTDVVIEKADAGYDRVFASASYTLSANLEELQFEDENATTNLNGTGNALDNFIDGNAGNNVLSGLDGEDFAGGEGGNDTLLGGNGNDDLRGGDGNDVVNGDAGDDWLQGDEENDRLDGGAGDDTMWGGDDVDTLLGGAGNDMLDGGEGDGHADSLNGGAGDDEYYVGAGDTVSEAGGSGVDTVFSRVDFTLATGVEALYLTSEGLTGTGNAGNNFIDGFFGDDLLIGLAGNDVLDGAEGSDEVSADTLRGGLGNDRYLVDGVNDVVEEGAAEGTLDHVFTTLSFYVLGANVENLTIGNGSDGVMAIGNNSANLIVANSGSAGADELRGLGGNDTLDGGIGTPDTLYGGTGNDTYIFRSADDRAVELTNEGTADTVRAYFDLTLGNNLENGVLIAGGEGIELIGNELGNSLTGNQNDNFLWGRGGADVLIGLGGNDEYLVETGDTVNETAAGSGGIDTVIALLPSYTLGTNVENLRLAPMAGPASGTGNSLSNQIDGNSSDNTLSGLGGNDVLFGGAGDDILLGGAGNDVLDGGRGADDMTGGAGNDLYRVNMAGDAVLGENSTLTGGGTDTIESSVSFSLVDAQGVERLTLIGSAANGTGNSIANVITGNVLRNVLSGGGNNDSLDGGSGDDTLNGDAGNDTLNGGGGADLMQGGAGNDRYLANFAGDVIVEADTTAGGGVDTVEITFFSGETYLLGDGLEHLIMTGGAFDAQGNAANNSITGSANDDFIDGVAGNDTLLGGAGNDVLDGGDDNDQLSGGAGDDTYFVDRGDGAGAGTGEDVVTEAANGGIDLVFLMHSAPVNYVAPVNVEDLGISDFEGSVDGINITGNALDNIISGNQGANILTGGAGNDNLTGAGGNDTLIGDAGDDMLGGGLGADSMRGGAGNDTYSVDNAGDVVNETIAGSSGTDTVLISMTGEGLNPSTYTLGANVENAEINHLDTSPVTFTGNGLANHILFDAGDPITLNAEGGNDTVGNLVSATVDPADLISLNGGDGDDRLELSMGGGIYTNLTATGFETIALDVGEGVTWNQSGAAERYELSGSGGLTLGQQVTNTTYVLDGFVDGLTLDFFETGMAVSLDLLDDNTVELISTEISVLNVAVLGTDNGLNVSGTTGTSAVNITGAGSLELRVANGQEISLTDYSGALIELTASSGEAINTINVDNTDTEIQLFQFEGGAFQSITLETTGQAAGGSDIRIGSDTLGLENTLFLVGAADEILRLDTSFIAGESIALDGTAFSGDLFWTNSGANGMTYFAGDSRDTLNLGAAGETLNFGANLDHEDFISDSGGFDTLNADLTDIGITFPPSLFIENIEVINFTFNFSEAGTEFIDADLITSDSGLGITLNGAEGTHVVTVENLHGNLGVTGSGLTVNAFAVNSSGEGGYMLAGDDGHDVLSVEGDSDDSLAGGLGNDTLSGGEGADWFAFDTAAGPANVDTILDFQSALEFEFGTDRIALDSSAFGALLFDGEGNLVGGQFLVNAGGAALDGDDRLIYDDSTGALYYDADGIGVGSTAVQFAQLGGGATGTAIPELSESDFVQLMV